MTSSTAFTTRNRNAILLLNILALTVLEADAATRSSGRARRIAGGAIAGIIIAIVVVILLCCLCACLLFRRRRSRALAPGAGPAPGMAQSGPAGFGGMGGKFGGLFGGRQNRPAGPQQAAGVPAMPQPTYNNNYGQTGGYGYGQQNQQYYQPNHGNYGNDYAPPTGPPPGTRV